MKKILLSLFVVVLTASSINAQSAMITAETTTEQKKPNELTKISLLKLQSDLGIDNNQGGSCYPVFENYFTARVNASEGLSASEIAQKEVQGGFIEIANKRDTQLEAIFTALQFVKWKQVSVAFMRAVAETK